MCDYFKCHELAKIGLFEETRLVLVQHLHRTRGVVYEFMHGVYFVHVYGLLDGHKGEILETRNFASWGGFLEWALSQPIIRVEVVTDAS